VLLRDAYSNAAAPTAAQRLVAVVQYITRWPRAAWAPAVSNTTRIELVAEAGGGVYPPWAGAWEAQAAGEVVLSVLLEERLADDVVKELQVVAATVHSSFLVYGFDSSRCSWWRACESQLPIRITVI
jgi:hypothetical protein